MVPGFPLNALPKGIGFFFPTPPIIRLQVIIESDSIVSIAKGKKGGREQSKKLGMPVLSSIGPYPPPLTSNLLPHFCFISYCNSRFWWLLLSVVFNSLWRACLSLLPGPAAEHRRLSGQFDFFSHYSQGSLVKIKEKVDPNLLQHTLLFLFYFSVGPVFSSDRKETGCRTMQGSHLGKENDFF